MGDIDVYPNDEQPLDSTIVRQPGQPSSPGTGTIWIDTDEGAGVGLSSIIGYAEQSADLAISTETALPGKSVTVTVPAGRRLRVSTQGQINNDATGGGFVTRIKEDGVTVGRVSAEFLTASTGLWYSGDVIVSPSAGTHTYTVTGNKISGGGSGTYFGNTAVPASYLLVEDITGTLWPAGQSIGAGAIASEAWNTWVPVLTQGVSVTYTNTYSRYSKIGRTVTAQFDLAITSSGTAATNILIALPVPPAATSVEMGVGFVFDASAGILYKGSITMVSGINLAFRYYTSTSAGGFLGADGMTAALASGDVIRGTITYEAAS